MIGCLFITGLLFAGVVLYCLIDPVAAMGVLQGVFWLRRELGLESWTRN